MSEFIYFLKAHVLEYLPIIIGFISLLVIILKKNKVIDNSLLAVLVALPSWIKEAEALPEKSKKYAYVFAKAVATLVAETGLKEKEVLTKYSIFIDQAIESILSTPQKKG